MQLITTSASQKFKIFVVCCHVVCALKSRASQASSSHPQGPEPRKPAAYHRRAPTNPRNACHRATGKTTARSGAHLSSPENSASFQAHPNPPRRQIQLLQHQPTKNARTYYSAPLPEAGFSEARCCSRITGESIMC